MKKTLAEQVDAFMKANGLSSQAMADRVRAMQKKSGVEPTVKRQNIDGVLGGSIQRPLYLVELALAMGTTAEALSTGKFRAGAEPPEEPATAPNPLPAALTVVAESLAESDRFARVWPKVSRLLSDVAEETVSIGTFAQRLAPLLPQEIGAGPASDNEPRAKQIGGALPSTSRFPTETDEQRFPAKHKRLKAAK